MAANFLGPLGDDVPRWVFDVSMEAAYGEGTAIRAALRAAGVDTKGWWRQQWRWNLKAVLAEGEDHRRRLLDDIASLDSSGSIESSDASLWALNEVGGLLQSARFAKQNVRGLRSAFVDDSQDLRRGWLSALCDAYGLDKPMIAAQARLLLSTFPRIEVDWSAATTEPPKTESRTGEVVAAVGGKQQEVLLACLDASSSWLARTAANVLVNIEQPIWDGDDLLSRDLSSRSMSRAALIRTVGLLTSKSDVREVVAAAARSGDASLRVAAGYAIDVAHGLDPDGSLAEAPGHGSGPGRSSAQEAARRPAVQ